jgi:hypothetical protein
MPLKETTSKAIRDQTLAKALADLIDGAYANVNQASVATRAPRKTLYRYTQGGQTRHQANLHRQALSPNKERALVKWVEHLSCTGHPVHHKFLRELAEEIRKPRVELENCQFSPLGKQWVSRFLLRNPSLKFIVAKSIERAHKEVTEEQLWNWFICFKHIIDQYGILSGNVYNMDETGSSPLQR